MKPESEAVRGTIEEIMRLVTLDDSPAAIESIKHLDREVLQPLRKPANVGDTADIRDHTTSVCMYLTVARKELESKNKDGALVALGHALASWILVQDRP